ncbi:MAG: alpha/beta hydrolase [Bacteroides sp.]|nr:alpha/beta hydrolase [Roseburia sp.]MCM1345878.1 alpha/beta hydrolase [Bacteroides sp.]MCM1421230.1 alpha/beta hydrolase [Bacteroides sp.]
MRKIFKALVCMFFAAGAANAQQVLDMDLWQNGLPNSNGIDSTQPYDDAKRNFKPSIRVFLPAKENANGKAVVCCPGGGYTHLSMENEGYNWAEFYNKLGFAFVVLKYRMPNGVTEVPISDAKEALRVVRENAEKWNIHPDKVGIMGSSAGGHLASTVATHSDSLTAPAFQILFYPVITFDYTYTHEGSRHGLIGKNAAQETVDLYSNEKQVSRQTPPAIMLLSDDDRAVPSPNSVNYYLALKHNQVPASLHIYPSGGHGWGFRENFKYHEQMLEDLTAWLRTLK